MSRGKRKLSGVYLLPNLITTSALFCGFYSITLSILGNYSESVIYILIAMILDGLDGRVARLTNTQTTFGEYYDSLSDMLCFGVAPALLIYLSSLSGFTSGYISKIANIACFIYIAATAIRLARFNSRNQASDKKYFVGLASPAAAAILICYVWLITDLNLYAGSYIFYTITITLALSLLMVSNLAYASFKDFNFKQKVPILTLFIISLIISFISFDPPKVLFVFFLLYGISGPFLYILRKIRRNRYNDSDLRSNILDKKDE